SRAGRVLADGASDDLLVELVRDLPKFLRGQKRLGFLRERGTDRGIIAIRAFAGGEDFFGRFFKRGPGLERTQGTVQARAGSFFQGGEITVLPSRNHLLRAWGQRRFAVRFFFDRIVRIDELTHVLAENERTEVVDLVVVLAAFFPCLEF